MGAAGVDAGEPDGPNFSSTIEEQQNPETETRSEPGGDDLGRDLSGDKAPVPCHADGPVEGIADAPGESEDPAEPGQERDGAQGSSLAPLSAAWASVIREPEPPGADGTTAPLLVEEDSIVPNQAAEISEADDSPGPFGEELPIATSMVNESPDSPRNHEGEEPSEHSGDSPATEEQAPTGEAEADDPFASANEPDIGFESEFESEVEEIGAAGGHEPDVPSWLNGPELKLPGIGGPVDQVEQEQKTDSACIGKSSEEVGAGADSEPAELKNGTGSLAKADSPFAPLEVPKVEPGELAAEMTETVTGGMGSANEMSSPQVDPETAIEKEHSDPEPGAVADEETKAAGSVDETRSAADVSENTETSKSQTFAWLRRLGAKSASDGEEDTAPDSHKDEANSDGDGDGIGDTDARVPQSDFDAMAEDRQPELNSDPVATEAEENSTSEPVSDADAQEEKVETDNPLFSMLGMPDSRPADEVARLFSDQEAGVDPDDTLSPLSENSGTKPKEESAGNDWQLAAMGAAEKEECKAEGEDVPESGEGFASSESAALPQLPLSDLSAKLAHPPCTEDSESGSPSPGETSGTNEELVSAAMTGAVESDTELPSSGSDSDVDNDLEAPAEEPEKIESIPAPESEFATAPDTPDASTDNPAPPVSEWTPFEFSDAEKNVKPSTNMNPITPSNPSPNTPSETSSGDAEDKIESGELADSAAPSTVPGASAQTSEESPASAVAGDDSPPQTVKKSALPPLVGMAGVAGFPLAGNEEKAATGGPNVEQTPPPPQGEVAADPPESGDAEPPAETGNGSPEADEGSSPVKDWMADLEKESTENDEPASPQPRSDADSSGQDVASDGNSAVQALAEAAADDDSSDEAEMDPARADALARFAARIDGAALENAAPADDDGGSGDESDSDSELLPWEKVAQENKAKAENGGSADAEDSKGKILESGDGNVRIDLDEEPKEKEDTFVNNEHKSAEMSEEEAAREKEYAAIIMGQAAGGGAPMTNHQRRKRLKKKRRRRILMTLFVLFLGSVGALMYYKPGFQPKNLKTAVSTSWNEGKSQFDKGKLSDFSAIVDPLIALWEMGPDGAAGGKDDREPAPGNTATAQAAPPTAPAEPVTSPGPEPVAPSKPTPVSILPKPKPDVVVAIPAPDKAKPVVARPVALPEGSAATPHAAGTATSNGETAAVPDSFTRPAPGETDEQRGARLGGEQVLKGFYGAKGAEEKLGFVLSPNEVAAEIEEAYPSPVDSPTIRSMEFKGRLVDSGTQRAFGVFDVRENENGDRHRWCVPEVSRGEFKIDWGLYRQLANDELTRFLADPKAEPIELRLLLRRGAEVAAEESPWSEPSLEMAVLMPLDDGSPSRILMKRSTHDDLGLNRDLGDGMARVGNFQLSWVADGEGSEGGATPSITAIKNWGAWPASPASTADAQTSVSSDSGEKIGADEADSDSGQ